MNRNYLDNPNWLLNIYTILFIAILVRLFYFTGLGLGDDGIYVTQILAHASGMWPPLPDHWSTRTGLTLPTTFLLFIFGTDPWSFVLYPFITSLIKVYVCYVIARNYLSENNALLAALLLATFPLDVIYATHLFPDTLNGLFSSIALIFWIKALKSNNNKHFYITGIFLGVSYLCHETVIVQAPIYLVLWLSLNRKITLNHFSVLLIPILFILAEMLLYHVSADNAFYRFDSMLSQQENTTNLEKHIFAPAAGASFMLAPISMLFTSHEYGAHMIIAMFFAFILIFKSEQIRPYAIWLLLGYFWIYYGTTVPHDWVPLARDPRYSLFLTIPAALIIAAGLDSLPKRVKATGIILLLSSALILPSMEQGNKNLEPYKEFVKSEYVSESTMGCYDFIVNHWVLGFEKTAPFFYAPELLCGPGKTQQLEAMGFNSTKSLMETRYIVIAQRHSEMIQELTNSDWKIIKTYTGHPTFTRALIAKLLSHVPGQHHRVHNILHPPGILVLARS